MARVSWLGLVVASLLAGVVIVGFGMRVLDDRSGPPILIEDPRADATMVIAVHGAVASPGVYELAGDARVRDAVAAAGGPRPGADMSGVNLARRIQDEDEVAIPSMAPTRGPDLPTASEPADSIPPAVNSSGSRVNLNAATVAELDQLPGVGPVLAQRIIDYRDEQGPYQSADDLERVQGISARMVEELRALVSVGA